MVDKIRDFSDFLDILSKQNSVSESVTKQAQRILGEFAISDSAKYKAYYFKARDLSKG